MKLNKRLLWFTAVLVVLTTLSKLLFAPRIEWSGFSPVMAIALFSGMIVSDKSKSFLYPLVALILSDSIIQVLYLSKLFPFAGFYNSQMLNYALLLGAVLIGWALKGKNYLRIFSGALAAPTLFFLMSNSIVWMTQGGYIRPMNAGGLLLCLEDGLPFYKNSITGTFVFLPVLMFMYNYLTAKNYRIKLV
jgi:hypothetical protein